MSRKLEVETLKRDKEKDLLMEVRAIEDRYFKPRPEWEEITEIWTLGFPKDTGYLSAALEIYLIERLRPSRNKAMSG